MATGSVSGSTKFAALHVPAYRSYFVVLLLSMIADNIEHVISYWVMFQAFHSPALAGFAVISHWVPFLLFSLHTGALADRYDCRKLIHVSQALYIVASVAWGLLFLTDTLQMWHAVVILLIHGAAGVIVAPASQLIIHEMVGREQLPSAIRLNASSRYLAILLGPAIGGGLMLLLGPAWGLLANVLIYLPFTVFTVRTPYTGHGGAAASRSARAFGWNDVGRVLAIAKADPRIMTMIALAGASSFFIGNAFQAQMPEYAQYLGADDGGALYSILLAANAAGAILGVVWLEASANVRPSVRGAMLFAILWGITMGLFPMAQSYATAVGLLVLSGVFSIAFTSMAQTLVQLLAPAAVRGSIVGLFNTSMLGLRAGAGVMVGVVGTFIGVRRSLELSSFAFVLVALWLLARERMANDRPAAVAVAESEPQ
jgi:MFS family permease